MHRKLFSGKWCFPVPLCMCKLKFISKDIFKDITNRYSCSTVVVMQTFHNRRWQYEFSRMEFDNSQYNGLFNIIQHNRRQENKKLIYIVNVKKKILY